MLLDENLVLQFRYSARFISMQHFNVRAHTDNGHKNVAGLRNPLTHSPHTLGDLHLHSIFFQNAILQD